MKRKLLKPSLAFVALIVIAYWSVGRAQINNGGGGSGSGTVGNCAAAGNAYYSASGTTTTCDTAVTDNGSGTVTGTSLVATGATGLSAGANSGNAGVLTLFGSTSGSATITAPAVAGTASNAISSSNAFKTLSELQSFQATNTGILRLGSDTNCFIQRNASNIMTFNCGTEESFLDDVFMNANGKRLITGSGAVTIHNTAPTIAGAGCGGSGATITAGSGTAGFAINVGSTPGSACTITMPSASNSWICQANDQTTQSSSVFVQKQTGAVSTTSVTITNFNTSAAATAFTASDVLEVSCMGR